MKITKERLEQLVKEELSIGFGSIGGEEPKKEGHDSDGHMAKQNLWKMAEYAKELYNLIDDDEDLEPWVEEKIAIAAFMMDSVGHYMQYEKNTEHADSSMSMDKIDLGGGDDEYDLESDDEEFEFEPEEGEEYDDEDGLDDDEDEEYEDEEEEDEGERR